MEPEVLYPEKRFLTKTIMQAIVLFLLIAGSMALLGYLIGVDEGGSQGAAWGVAIPTGISLLGLLIALLLLPPYYRSLRYEIRRDEIVVEAGIVTKSVKHVPYRTVTNLQVARGPFDRLFGLGTLKVQTAGMSGQSGVEESLVGLSNVNDVYQQVGATLRRFRGAMAATAGSDDEGPDEGPLQAILTEVRAVRQLLERR